MENWDESREKSVSAQGWEDQELKELLLKSSDGRRQRASAVITQVGSRGGVFPFHFGFAFAPKRSLIISLATSCAEAGFHAGGAAPRWDAGRTVTVNLGRQPSGATFRRRHTRIRRPSTRWLLWKRARMIPFKQKHSRSSGWSSVSGAEPSAQTGCRVHDS